MAKVKSRQESGSILRAIDGTHLRWNEFRTDVLQPFDIRIVHAEELNGVPSELLSRLQQRLVDLGRFDHQREKWRTQVTGGQGFASPTLFPPNILPQLNARSKLQRCLLPKMSRETLPRRAKAANSLFELPSPRPLYAVAFTTESLSEIEHGVLPSSLSPTGTVVNFSSGMVGSGVTLHCPFLIFERCQGGESDDIENALNMCAISGAQCVKGLQEISQRAQAKFTENVIAFSCLLNDDLAILNLHTIDEQGRCKMSVLFKFNLLNDGHFNTFQAWIEAIEEWGSNALLPDLKDFLTKMSVSGESPPASPMPSLTLSVDTEVGQMSGLLQTLRKTFPAIAWRSDEVCESPINSSIAHCGTPADGRRSQSLLLQSPSTTSFASLMRRRGNSSSVVSPIHIPRNPYTPFTPVRPSPFSPRYSVAAPTSALDIVSESPCRPGSYSPSVPPLDQPWTAKSPLLVAQKRLEVAMNEIQDLRHQVESLQTELATRNDQLMQRLAAIESEQKQRKAIDERDTHVVAQESVPEPEIEMAPPVIGKNTKQNWFEVSLVHETYDALIAQLIFIAIVIVLASFGYYFCGNLLPMVYQVLLSVIFGFSWLDISSVCSHASWTWATEVQNFSLPTLSLGGWLGLGT